MRANHTRGRTLIGLSSFAGPDLCCDLHCSRRFWLGVGYRPGDAFLAMKEFQINLMFRVGHSRDATTSERRGYNSGSHEVIPAGDLGMEPSAIKGPRSC